VLEQLDVIATHPQVLVVKPEIFFCDSFIHNRCIAELENKPLYFDDNHLNALGAKYVAEMIFAEMQHAGWI
jgi:lysophospholipase L1-like esterase